MFSLVEFSDGSYYITESKHVRKIQNTKCIVKYKSGAKYDAILLSENESYDALKKLEKSLAVQSGNANDNDDTNNIKNHATSSKDVLISAIHDTVPSSSSVNGGGKLIAENNTNDKELLSIPIDINDSNSVTSCSTNVPIPDITVANDSNVSGNSLLTHSDTEVPITVALSSTDIPTLNVTFDKVDLNSSDIALLPMYTDNNDPQLEMTSLTDISFFNETYVEASNTSIEPSLLAYNNTDMLNVVTSSPAEVSMLNVTYGKASPYGKTPRKRWSQEEKEAALRIFSNNISNKQLPSLDYCQKAIKKERVLSSRTPQQVKAWVNNYIVSRNKCKK